MNFEDTNAHPIPSTNVTFLSSNVCVEQTEGLVILHHFFHSDPERNFQIICLKTLITLAGFDPETLSAETIWADQPSGRPGTLLCIAFPEATGWVRVFWVFLGFFC